ncbi:MAG: hypothetical protein A2X23_08675 [Chloroflexi bacterium GWC2_73_18]|nr:MAG: hypothetical protein A2X23_08675 [Chloroflexi bacterium GWC2_73_18]
MNGELTEETARRAVEVLRRCAGPRGFTASGTADGYPEVWARDAMVTLVGVCAARLEELLPAARASLETLAGGQSELGRIPLNVDPAGRPGTANAGALDGNLWFLIGHRALHEAFGTTDLLARHRDALVRAMRWLRHHDVDEDGLLESQEASGWADLLAYRGKVLYDNVLYVLALRAYGALAAAVDLPEATLHARLADRAAERLEALHWVASRDGLWETAASPALRGGHDEAQRLAQLATAQLWNRPYFLPWVGFREYGDWCDVLGNSLAILAGIAGAERAAAILDHLEAVGAAEPYPAKAIWPPIRPGDRDWRDYYRNNGLNLPDQYHNGGIWPLVGGMLVAAEVGAGRRERAATHLERLAEACRLGREGEWEFSEWLHGGTGRPMGRAFQAWSAAGYLVAHRAVATGEVPSPLS